DAEVATSRPQLGLGREGQIYVAEFDTEGGINIPMAEQSWYFGSLPAYGRTLRSRFGGLLEPARATTLVWQNFPRPDSGQRRTFTIADIDSLARFGGAGFVPNETLLWLTLHPLRNAGRFDPSTGQPFWTVPNAPTGRRFRSIRAVLSP